MRSTKPKYLLDVNALIALADPDSDDYPAIQRWFDADGNENWGVCPLTEAGFIRVTTNPKYRGPGRTVAQATAILAEFSKTNGYSYWSIRDPWTDLTASFASRIQGHNQITDAYLLGMAIKENGVLVTFDKAVAYMAGSEFPRHLLVLHA